jgi:dinuclear metal center YbgI/SA1388 family protein
MEKLSNLVKFLDRELKTKKIKDISVNGLQVKAKNREVKTIGFATDACLSTFEKAKKEKVDLLIVHHGVKWKPQKYISIQGRRIDWLKKYHISLYTAHAPLDLNERDGHNIGLAQILNLKKIKKFGKLEGVTYGFSGRLKKPMKIEQIAKRLNKTLKTKSKIFNFNKKEIKTLGIVAGSSGGCIEEAARKKLDCFLLGEVRLEQVREAQDLKLNLIVAGHYATETIGLKLLEKKIKSKFEVNTIFIDDPVQI